MSDSIFNATGGLSVGRNQISAIDINNNATFLSLTSGISTFGATNASSLSISGATVFSTIPTTLTAIIDTNSTQLATTAFVLSQGSSSIPLMDGTASYGTSTKWTRQDHIHPSDTSKANLLTPAFQTNINIVGAVLTSVSSPFLTASQTWNNSSIIFNGLVLNITNTASNSASSFVNFQQNGATTFNITSGGTINQQTTLSHLPRTIISNLAELRSIREYQDLDDSQTVSGIQGFDPYTTSEFAQTFNAAWNFTTSTYVKDRALALDHAFIERLEEIHWKKQWWFSDGTIAGSSILWSKKVEFDFPNSNYSFFGNVISNTTPTLPSHLTRKDYVDLNYPMALVGSPATSAASGFTSTGGSVSLSRVGTLINIETAGIIGATTFTGDLNVGTPSKASIAAATGNTILAGTLTVNGISTLNALSVSTFTISGSTTFNGVTTTAAWNCGGNVGIGSLGGPYNKFTVDTSGNINTLGILTVVGTTTLNATNLTTVVINGISDVISVTLTTASITQVVLVQFAANLYRSCDCIIQASDTSNAKFQITKLIAIHNGTLANLTEYGSTNFVSDCGTFTATISGGYLQILVTPSTAASTIFKITSIVSRL